MELKSAVAAIAILAATAGFAQSAASGPTGSVTGAPMAQATSFTGKGSKSSVAGNRAAAEQAPASLRQRVQDMEGTLAKMHVVLEQMRTKASRNPKDSLVKADLDMWELMVAHLDQELKELRVAMLAREDMEARRVAMYKQADAKADAAAQAAQRADHATQAPSGRQSPGNQTTPGPSPSTPLLPNK